MITANNMFLIGAADRNVGKTEFACTLIKKLVLENKSVIGIKVTAIREKGGKCPRGGKGCGVCSSLSGDFCIEEEKKIDSAKDTSRMLKAGAKAVFWLRIMSTALESGITELFTIIEKNYGKNIAIVCESNSLRNAVIPGLFFILNKSGNAKIKDSCKEVESFSDKKVSLISEKEGFDFDINKISFIDGNWYVKNNASAIILAGGKSSRMTINKSKIIINGKSIVHHISEQLNVLFEDIIIGTNDPCIFVNSNLKIVPDELPNLGPLMAIYSCLKKSDHEINFITGCDIPNMNLFLIKELLKKIKDFDAVIPRLPDGKIEPLYAVYRKKIIFHIFESLRTGNYRIRSFFNRVNVCYLDIMDNSWYFNLNTDIDYKNFLMK